jgi:hypothetical protein
VAGGAAGADVGGAGGTVVAGSATVTSVAGTGRRTSAIPCVPPATASAGATRTVVVGVAVTGGDATGTVDGTGCAPAPPRAGGADATWRPAVDDGSPRASRLSGDLDTPPSATDINATATTSASTLPANVTNRRTRRRTSR